MSADSELLNSWCQGDQEAYAVLLARHHGLVRSACLRQAPPEAVDDCLQAVFLVLFRRPKAAAKAPSLVAWLLRVSSNVSHNARRAQVRRQVAEQAASAQSARQEADPSEALSHLDECLLLLPEPQRVAVSLQYLAGYSSNEVAATLGVSRNHAYKLVHRGLAGLRDLLARRQVVVGSTALLGLLGAQAQAAALPVSATTLISITTGTPSAGASALATGVIKTMTIAALSPFIAAAGLLLAIGTATVALSGEAPPVKPPAGAPAATAPVPGVAQPLVVQPVELALVDGRSVAGGLVGQTDVYLFLYSPSGGTVASFEKRFVASYTLAKDKKKIALNAARPLTVEEVRYWGWKGWPDAPPGVDALSATAKKPGAQAKAAGAVSVPAYAKETWAPPKRLLIWAKPGEGGDFSKTESWLVYGEAPTGKAWWDDQTDVLVPSAPGNQYKLLPGDHPELPEGRLSYTVRHIMVERHGFIQASGCTVFGNEWVHLGAKTNIRFAHAWHGSRNTYARFDFLPVQPLGTDSGDITFERALDRAKDKQRWKTVMAIDIGQYLSVTKDANASVELLGTFSSRDKFDAFKGMTILGPDCNFSNDTRNGMNVSPDATLVLLDGAMWGKRVDWTRGTSIKVDGKLQAGLPDRPLTRDATILVSTSDYGGHMKENNPPPLDGGGLVLSPKGSLRVFSSDPAAARLVFRCSLGDRDSSMQLINVDLLGDAVLDGVVFMDLWKGGLRLGDLKKKESWKHVSFVDCQSPKPEELYAVYQKNIPPSGYTENPAMKALSMSGWEKPEPTVANDVALDKLRQDVKAAEARCKELERAFLAIVGDDDAFCQTMATYGLAKVEWHHARRALWLAFAERMKPDGSAQPAKP